MNRKVSWSLAAMLGIFSPVVWALGLGDASIESFLGQSLDVRVGLISNSSEELQSVSAGLASADDFELLGLSRSAITVPLDFEVVPNQARPYIRITSDLNVNEPVIQVLLEVVWSNGKMLREYTLFLDPPTFESKAPPVVLKPESQPVTEVTPAVTRAIPPADSKPAADVVEQEPTKPGSQVVAKEEPVVREPIPGPAAAIESALPEETDSAISEDGVYGPVANGETLWSIATEYSRGSGYTVHQAMLAMQRKNPQAFMHDNINSLKRGAILRMPAASEMAELTSREALLEAVRQQKGETVASRPPVTEFNTPTVADSGDYQETFREPVSESAVEEGSGRLEVVPPEDEDQDYPGEEQLQAQGISSNAIREDLLRTEEELANAQQENAYLNQRIRELEAEAQARAEDVIAVQDTDMANLESNLSKKDASERDESPAAIVPDDGEQAWYAGKTGLIAGIAVVLIGLIVWGLRRRAAGFDDTEYEEVEQDDTSSPEGDLLPPGTEDSDTVVQLTPDTDPDVQPLTEPALEPVPDIEPDIEPASEPGIEPEFVPGIEPESEPDMELESESEAQHGSVSQQEHDDADDPEVDDPETKLDLARAYLSLGDKEASRSMLDEVMTSGSDAQKAEAKQMLDEI